MVLFGILKSNSFISSDNDNIVPKKETEPKYQLINSKNNFEKVLGKQGADRFRDLYKTTIKHRVRELQKLRPDMSSSIPEPVNTTSN